MLSHPPLSTCQEHGFLQACSCARQSPGNIRKCALFPSSASAKTGGGIRRHAQGNLASNSPACHQTATFSGPFPAMQNREETMCSRHCFKPLPCQCSAGGRKNKMLYLQLCLPAGSPSSATNPATWPQMSPCCATKHARGRGCEQTKPFRTRTVWHWDLASLRSGIIRI